MVCAKCGANNREGRKFCAKCAAPLARLCPQCGASNEPGEDFCGECAAALAKPQSSTRKKPDSPPIRLSATAADENLEGERKTITALFADIKGSMELMEDLDPEEARAIVDPALRLMMDAVHHYGGYVLQSTGDGIFALFGAPVAHEDHPQRALYAALRMQQAMSRYSDQAARGGKSSTRSARRRQHWRGRGAHHQDRRRAQRVYADRPFHESRGADANPGADRICCRYRDDREVVRRLLQLQGTGSDESQRRHQPVNVFEVTGLGPLRTRLEVSVRRGLTRFVGREREIAEMRRALELAKAGAGQIVAAMAEAGSGKVAFVLRIPARRAIGMHGARLQLDFAGKSSAYLPVIGLFNSYFEISSEDDAGRRRAKDPGQASRSRSRAGKHAARSCSPTRAGGTRRSGCADGSRAQA